VHTMRIGDLADGLRLPFSMLSDPSLRLADALSVPIFVAVFPPNGHARQLLAWLRAAPAAP